MPTTVGILPDLHHAAKERAAELNVTLSQFVADAVKERLEQPFLLRNDSYRGGGLREGVTWDRLLDYAYDNEPKWARVEDRELD